MKNKLLPVITFFLGIILVLIVNIFIFNTNNKIIYEKNSLSTSINKIIDATVSIKVGPTSTGSGFVYKKDKRYAYILTNEHVVTNTKDPVVVLSNGKEIQATILGKDKYIDLAVLRINKKYTPKVATLSSAKPKLGDTIFTIGTPIDYEYHGTVTSGIISGLDRKVKAIPSNSIEEIYMHLTQIDAPINSGNSGGPLLNINGEVIGICTLKIIDNNVEDMGFAIPITDAKKYLSTLESSKEIEWPTLGVELIDTNNGPKVTKVIDNKVLKEDDVISSIAGKNVENTKDINYEVSKFKVGNTIEIKYSENGRNITTKIVLVK